jgi:hypothetical protein
VAVHVKVIAILYLVFGAFGLLGALFSGLVFGALASFVGVSGEQGAPAGAAALGLFGTVLTVLFVVLSLPAIVCGIGLLKFRPWARILGIVLAVIALLKVPIGTIFGVYALVILFRRDTEALFSPSAALPSTVDRA